MTEAIPYESILVERRGRVEWIILNKPERKNPLGAQMVNELLYALDAAKEADDVRVVVLTGAGNAFSAGADLKQFGQDAGSKLPLKGDFPDLLLRFRELGKPVIARVPGIAMGGGLGMVCVCDFAVGCESAVLSTPEIKRGLFPFMIMAVMSRVVPRRRLLGMMLLGDKLDAREALEAGLLTHVVPDDDLDRKVDEIAEKLAAQSPTAMRMGLAAFHRMSDQTMAEALPELQRDLMAALGTEDAKEGLLAFMQKREPSWTGR
jgi:enoyl-CoA hydratase/carnithine racemase